MTNEKLKEITGKVADVIREGGFILEGISDYDKYELLDIIASLHNELYNEVTGQYYDYMFHWANHGYGGVPDDGLFKEKKNDT
jgi:hypothetical protein